MKRRINSTLLPRPSLQTVRKAARPLIALALISFPVGSAWSYGPLKASLPFNDPQSPSAFPDDHARDIFKQVPTSTNADECLPLLTSIPHISSPSVLDRSQRPAGQIAVIGLLLGVRLAPGPLEKAGNEKSETLLSVGFSPDAVNGHRSALAVALYRDCRKEMALRDLSQTFRWSR